MRWVYVLQPSAAGGVTPANWLEPKFRILIYRSVIPLNVPPIITDVIEKTSGVPTADGVLLTSGGAAAGPYDMIAYRSPGNFDEFEVFHDEVHTCHFDTTWSQGGVSVCFLS